MGTISQILTSEKCKALCLVAAKLKIKYAADFFVSEICLYHRFVSNPFTFPNLHNLSIL